MKFIVPLLRLIAFPLFVILQPPLKLMMKITMVME
jgi:hypothetical protein